MDSLNHESVLSTVCTGECPWPSQRSWPRIGPGVQEEGEPKDDGAKGFCGSYSLTWQMGGTAFSMVSQLLLLFFF